MQGHTNTESGRSHRRRSATVPPSRREHTTSDQPNVSGLDPRNIPLPIASEWTLVPSVYEPAHHRRTHMFQYDASINGMITTTDTRISVYVLGVTTAPTDIATRYQYVLDHGAELSRQEIAFNPLSNLLAATARLGRQPEPNLHQPTPPLPTPNSRIGRSTRREQHQHSVRTATETPSRAQTVGNLFIGLIDSDSDPGDTNLFPEASRMPPN